MPFTMCGNIRKRNKENFISSFYRFFLEGKRNRKKDEFVVRMIALLHDVFDEKFSDKIINILLSK